MDYMDKLKSKMGDVRESIKGKLSEMRFEKRKKAYIKRISKGEKPSGTSLIDVKKEKIRGKSLMSNKATIIIPKNKTTKKPKKENKIAKNIKKGLISAYEGVYKVASNFEISSFNPDSLFGDSNAKNKKTKSMISFNPDAIFESSKTIKKQKKKKGSKKTKKKKKGKKTRKKRKVIHIKKKTTSAFNPDAII